MVPVFFRRVLPVKNQYDHTVKMEAAELMIRLTANLMSVRVSAMITLQKGMLISLFALGLWHSLCSNLSRLLFKSKRDFFLSFNFDGNPCKWFVHVCVSN